MDQNNENQKQSAKVNLSSKQAEEATPPAWWWVERSVWTEAMLTRLTSKEPANRVWYTLVDKTYNPANLQSAYEKVKRNGGSAGVDGQTLSQFERRAPEELRWLVEQLRRGSYRPQPVRRTWIDKPGSTDKRPLGIPVVRDRIVQGALRQVLEPIFETEFAEQSYGFRPGRGAKDALRRVDQLLKAGYCQVVDADLKSYFDTIPQERLLALVQQRVADGRVLRLVEGFLRAGVMEESKGWKPTNQGTPQGGVISPLLANIYLNGLDHQMALEGFEMIRYADDFVVLCRNPAQAQEALSKIRQWVTEAGLTLHPEKTRLVDANQPGGFDFLGYHFERGQRWPRKKSLSKLKDRVKQQTQRRDGRALQQIVQSLNRTLRGWYADFQHSQKATFPQVDGFVRRRLRSLLEKRRGRTRQGIGRAHQRWPNAWFAQMGLVSLEAEHNWTRTIVRLRTH